MTDPYGVPTTAEGWTQPPFCRGQRRIGIEDDQSPTEKGSAVTYADVVPCPECRSDDTILQYVSGQTGPRYTCNDCGIDFWGDRDVD